MYVLSVNGSSLCCVINFCDRSAHIRVFVVKYMFSECFALLIECDAIYVFLMSYLDLSPCFSYALLKHECVSM